MLWSQCATYFVVRSEVKNIENQIFFCNLLFYLTLDHTNIYFQCPPPHEIHPLRTKLNQKKYTPDFHNDKPPKNEDEWHGEENYQHNTNFIPQG